MMPAAKSCLFCSIVAGSIPATVIAREAEACGFLDSRPLFKGHVLVVSTAHAETLGDLPASSLAPFFATVQRIARALEHGLGADGSFVAINNRVSQSVPHLHAHVVPRHRGDGLRGFFWPRVKYESDAERDEFAARLRAAY